MASLAGCTGGLGGGGGDGGGDNEEFIAAEELGLGENWQARRIGAADNCSIEDRVMVIEPIGPHKDLAVRPLALEDDEAAEFTARVSNDTGAEVGGTVTLAVEIDEVHLFDTEFSENILV